MLFFLSNFNFLMIIMNITTQERQVDSKRSALEFEFFQFYKGLKDRGCELSLSGMLFTGIDVDKSSVLLHSSFLVPAPLFGVNFELKQNWNILCQ